MSTQIQFGLVTFGCLFLCGNHQTAVPGIGATGPVLAIAFDHEVTALHSPHSPNSTDRPAGIVCLAENHCHNDASGHVEIVESIDQTDPFEVLRGQIDNKRIYDAFMAAGMKLKDAAAGMPLETIQQEVRRTRFSTLKLPSPSVPAAFDFENMAKSSLLLGTLYDCGRCDEMHANVAGGVIVSEDGLCLTNQHVLDRRDEDTKILFAMDYQGRGYCIAEILAVNPVADVALIRLQGDGPFVPAPIAAGPPRPASPAWVLSHPSSEFFVLTTGIVSRHVKLTQRNRVTHWLEVTAEFGAGSSGSGVFNEHGELIGLVSRINPLFRNPQQRRPPEDENPRRPNTNSYAEMILRRCVTLDAIQSCFAK